MSGHDPHRHRFRVVGIEPIDGCPGADGRRPLDGVTFQAVPKQRQAVKPRRLVEPLQCIVVRVLPDGQLVIREQLVWNRLEQLVLFSIQRAERYWSGSLVGDRSPF